MHYISSSAGGILHLQVQLAATSTSAILSNSASIAEVNTQHLNIVFLSTRRSWHPLYYLYHTTVIDVLHLQALAIAALHWQRLRVKTEIKCTVHCAFIHTHNVMYEQLEQHTVDTVFTAAVSLSLDLSLARYQYQMIVILNREASTVLGNSFENNIHIKKISCHSSLMHSTTQYVLWNEMLCPLDDVPLTE